MDRFEELRRELERNCPALELRPEEPMSRHTTFCIGGPARLMALPRTAEEAVRAVKTAAKLEITPFFLGNGSNLLAADEGVERFLIKTPGGLCGIEPPADSNPTRITAESGVLLPQLAAFAQRQGLSGLEFAQGIPGSLGGGVTMNAGAYGGELAQAVRSVVCLSPDGTVETVDGEALGFGYRRSAFSGGERMILRVCLELSPGDPAEIREKMDDLAARRREKQPLEHPSAGSMFKRPPGHFAAALIDRCGLKGLTVGGAQVSEKHAGFVVNRGGASCADVLELVRQVKERVLRETGVELEMEVRVLK